MTNPVPQFDPFIEFDVPVEKTIKLRQLWPRNWADYAKGSFCPNVTGTGLEFAKEVTVSDLTKFAFASIEKNPQLGPYANELIEGLLLYDVDELNVLNLGLKAYLEIPDFKMRREIS